ncbi:MAG: hypothetical protein ACLGHL_00905 [Actinomycetota bacterium]
MVDPSLSTGTSQRRSLKYIRLAAFFASLDPSMSEIGLSVEEVESLVGQQLPGNARFPSWWRNDNHRMHSRAWLAAGWKVDRMDTESDRIIFTRTDQIVLD